MLIQIRFFLMKNVSQINMLVRRGARLYIFANVFKVWHNRNVWIPMSAFALSAVLRCSAWGRWRQFVRMEMCRSLETIPGDAHGLPTTLKSNLWEAHCVILPIFRWLRLQEVGSWTCRYVIWLFCTVGIGIMYPTRYFLTFGYVITFMEKL